MKVEDEKAKSPGESNGETVKGIEEDEVIKWKVERLNKLVDEVKAKKGESPGEMVKVEGEKAKSPGEARVKLMVKGGKGVIRRSWYG